MNKYKYVLLPLSLLVFSHITLAKDDETLAKGKQLYLENCSSCHGIDGGGHGALELETKNRPADLRVLALDNNRKFPHAQIRKIIDGRVQQGNIRSHVNGDMPVWGKIFTDEGGKGAQGELIGDAINKSKIEALVSYLESIQVKDSSDILPD